MNRRIKVGVVGVGSLGQHHARIYAEMEEAELVGVYDADQDRAAKIARSHRVTAFPTLDALADAAEALSVVVPTDKHHQVASLLIDKGRHLLIEKPITATTAEAEDLVRLSQAKRVILQVGHIERFNQIGRAHV